MLSTTPRVKDILPERDLCELTEYRDKSGGVILADFKIEFSGKQSDYQNLRALLLTEYQIVGTHSRRLARPRLTHSWRIYVRRKLDKTGRFIR